MGEDALAIDIVLDWKIVILMLLPAALPTLPITDGDSRTSENRLLAWAITEDLDITPLLERRRSGKPQPSKPSISRIETKRVKMTEEFMVDEKSRYVQNLGVPVVYQRTIKVEIAAV